MTFRFAGEPVISAHSYFSFSAAPYSVPEVDTARSHSPPVTAHPPSEQAHGRSLLSACIP